MAPEVKQRYQQMAEEGRQKYDQDMAAYRQGNYTAGDDSTGATPSPATQATGVAVATTTAAASVSYRASVTEFRLLSLDYTM